MAGDVTMTLADGGPASVGMQSGRVKALAVTSPERLKDYPNVPTLAELGIDLKVSLWIGLLAPAGTTPEIIRRLNSELAKATMTLYQAGALTSCVIAALFADFRA